MLAGSVLLLLLSASDPVGAEPPGLRAELDACAERIEEMKARSERGTELDRLLRRAEELARELERRSAAPPVHLEGPTPEELRERADAARDEVDRLAAEIAALDLQLQGGRGAPGEPEPTLQRTALGAAPPPQSVHRARALQAERAALSERRARAEEEAARLESEAAVLAAEGAR